MKTGRSAVALMEINVVSPEFRCGTSKRDEIPVQRRKVRGN